MRTWCHVALMVCLSIKWLTNQVAAESIICDDDQDMCAKPKSEDRRTYLRFGKDGEPTSDEILFPSLPDGEDSGTELEIYDAKMMKREDPYIRFGKKNREDSEDDLTDGTMDDKEKRQNPYIRFGKRQDPYIRFGKRQDPYIRFGKRQDPYIRFGKRQDPYIRFGKRQDPYIRFGKRQDPYIRFGKRQDPYIRFGKRQDPYIRFGKRQDPYIRFGKRQDPYIRFGKRQDPYIRFGKRQDPYIRFGKRQDPYIRFGKRQDPYIRFGKRQDPYIRFGKRQDPYIRFGKRQDPYIRFGKRQDPYIRFGKRQDPYIRFGKRQDPYIRFGKRDESYKEQFEKQREGETFIDSAAVLGHESAANRDLSAAHNRQKRSEDQSQNSATSNHQERLIRSTSSQIADAKTANKNTENIASSGDLYRMTMPENQAEQQDSNQNINALSHVARNGPFRSELFENGLLGDTFSANEIPGQSANVDDLQAISEAEKYIRQSRVFGGRSSLPRFGRSSGKDPKEKRKKFMRFGKSGHQAK